MISYLKSPTAVGKRPLTVADETETQLEVKYLGERLFLKDAGADYLAGDGGEDFVFARGENVHAGNLRLLVKLLGAKLNRFAGALVLGLLERRLEKYLLQQIGVVKILRATFEKRSRGEGGLLNVQILCLLKLQQRADVVSLGRVNDDDALTLFELTDEVITVKRRERSHGDGDEAPSRPSISVAGKSSG